MTDTKVKINIPDAQDETAVTVVGDRIIFVTIEHDSDCENPCTSSDGVGVIHSASRRHINYKNFDELRDLLAADDDAVALSYFEHGLCKWMVCGSTAEQTPGVEFQFDGVRFAGVWVPDDSVRESYTGQDGLTRKQWMAKQAESACETYTEWANGQCFGYRMAAYTVRIDDETQNRYEDEDDYRFKKALVEDSCWGFIGWDYAVEATTEAAEGMLP